MGARGRFLSARPKRLDPEGAAGVGFHPPGWSAQLVLVPSSGPCGLQCLLDVGLSECARVRVGVYVRACACPRVLKAAVHGRTHHRVAGAQTARPAEERRQLAGQLGGGGGASGGGPPGAQQLRVLQLLQGEGTSQHPPQETRHISTLSSKLFFSF